MFSHREFLNRVDKVAGIFGEWNIPWRSGCLRRSSHENHVGVEQE